MKRMCSLKRAVAALWATSALLAQSGCAERSAEPLRIAAADAAIGRQLIAERGCGACHLVPGITAANGVVGPPLEAWSLHTYIAGKYPNRPEILVAWLLEPHALAPATAMPDLGLTEIEARNIAAYLYSLP
jgi:mono/diheme cytochrome c family protein